MRHKFSLLIIPICALLFDCSSIPETHYYLLDYPIDHAVINENPKHNLTLGVLKFEVDPLYDQDKIVYRESLYEGKFYNYHRWISPPADIITQKIIEHIGASNLFMKVDLFPSHAKPDFLLRGKIKAFEEWDQNNQWFSHVNIMFELIDFQQENVVWKEHVDVKNPVAEKKPLQLVESINETLKQCVEHALENIDNSLSSYN